MTNAPDEKLVRRAQRGDKAAFAELFTRYEGRIFGYLYRMVGDRAWAEDLAQEAFIQAHQHLGRLGPPYDFKSWVYRIASNMALDGLRRYRREVPLPDWDGGEATAPEPADQRREGAPEDQARLAEVRVAVWRAIHQLPDNYRQVLVLREIDGLSYNEIAAVLGLSLDNVRVTLHRARLQFRDRYGLQAMVEEGRLACQELDVLLSAYVDGELDRAARQRARAHIAACPACQKKQRDLLAISGLLGALVPVFPPPTLRPRFLSRLQHLSPSGGTDTPGRGRGGSGGGGYTPWLLLPVLGGSAVVLIVAAIVLGLLLLPYTGAFTPPSGTPPSTTTEKPTPTPPAAPTDVPPPPAAPTGAPALPPTSTPIPTPTPTDVPPTSTPTPPPTSTPQPPSPTSTPTSTPIPTPPPTSTPAPHITFWADATTVQAGTCTTIHWEATHVQAVYFDGDGVPGTGSHQTCPCTDETHSLDVVLPDGSHDVREITIQVTGTCVTPTLDRQPPPAPDPTAPAGGAVLSCRNSTTLSWNAVKDPSGVAGYRVRLERREGSTWQPEGEWGLVRGTSFDVPVSCGFAYRWSVRAMDGAGNLGPWSEWARFGIGID